MFSPLRPLTYLKQASDHAPTDAIARAHQPKGPSLLARSWTLAPVPGWTFSTCRCKIVRLTPNVPNHSSVARLVATVLSLDPPSGPGLRGFGLGRRNRLIPLCRGRGRHAVFLCSLVYQALNGAQSVGRVSTLILN
jgi:hypothetical protein